MVRRDAPARRRRPDGVARLPLRHRGRPSLPLVRCAAGAGLPVVPPARPHGRTRPLRVLAFVRLHVRSGSARRLGRGGGRLRRPRVPQPRDLPRRLRPARAAPRLVRRGARRLGRRSPVVGRDRADARRPAAGRRDPSGAPRRRRDRRRQRLRASRTGGRDDDRLLDRLGHALRHAVPRRVRRRDGPALGVRPHAALRPLSALPRLDRVGRRVPALLPRSRGYTAASYILALTPVLAMAMSTLFEGKTWSAAGVGGLAAVLTGQWMLLRESSPPPESERA